MTGHTTTKQAAEDLLDALSTSYVKTRNLPLETHCMAELNLVAAALREAGARALVRMEQRMKAAPRMKPWQLRGLVLDEAARLREQPRD